MKRFRQTVDKFLDSDWYLLLIAGIVVLSWALRSECVGPLLVLALAGFILVIREDMTPLLPLICFAAFSYCFEERPGVGAGPANPVTQTYVTSIIVGGCLLAVCLGVHIYLYYVKPKRLPNFGSLWTGMAVAGAACLLSGIACVTYDKLNILKVFAVSVGVYAVYLVMLNSRPNDFKRYACKLIVLAGFLILCEMLVYYARLSDDFVWGESSLKSMRIGWGMTNSIGTLLVMAIPAAFYLSATSRRGWLYAVAAALFCAGLWITQSRGNLLIAFLVLPASFIVGLIKAPHGERRWIALVGAVCAAVILALVIVYWEQFVAPFMQKIEDGDPTRIRLIKDAWQRFLQNPVFGCGFIGDTSGAYVGTLWKVHCTPVQILSSAGVVGVLGFVLFYFQRYKTLVKRFSFFKFFALCSILAYEGYGFVDLTFFIIYQIFFVFLLLVACEKETAAEGGAKKSAKGA